MEVAHALEIEIAAGRLDQETARERLHVVKDLLRIIEESLSDRHKQFSDMSRIHKLGQLKTTKILMEQSEIVLRIALRYHAAYKKMADELHEFVDVS